jgi:hypothetical protein
MLGGAGVAATFAMRGIDHLTDMPDTFAALRLAKAAVNPGNRLHACRLQALPHLALGKTIAKADEHGPGALFSVAGSWFYSICERLAISLRSIRIEDRIINYVSCLDGKKCFD